MASRGLLGGLAGLGQGLAQAGQAYGEALKFEYLQNLRKQERADDRAYKEAQTQKQWDREDALLSEKRKYEKGLLQEDRSYKEAQAQQSAASDLALSDRKHEQAKELAALKASLEGGSPKDRILAAETILDYYKDAYSLSPADQRTIDGAKSALLEAAGMPSNVAPAGYSEDQLSAAEKYADERIEKEAGLFSRDSSDFERFDGDRNKAREAYRQQYLSEITGENYQSGSVGEALQDESRRGQDKRNSAATDAKIQDAFKKLRANPNNKNYSDEQLMAAIREKLGIR